MFCLLAGLPSSQHAGEGRVCLCVQSSLQQNGHGGRHQDGMYLGGGMGVSGGWDGGSHIEGPPSYKKLSD